MPTLPVYLGELQGRALGAKVEAWDPDGKPLIGEVGELVITEPMPSMPIFFWGDEDGSRLRESYFEHYPGVWRHGDWIEITERGTAIIYGRSDSTINRGGIRMGTSEIYRAVLADDAVVDALVVDIPREGTEGWMPLFVVLREGAKLDDELVARIKHADPHRLLAAPRPQRDPPDRRGPAHAERQGARGAGQAHPHGSGPPTRPPRATRWPTPPRSTSSSRWRRRRYLLVTARRLGSAAVTDQPIFEAEYVEQRSRLTTFFRLILAIPPHRRVLWRGASPRSCGRRGLVRPVFTGRYPQGLYDFAAAFSATGRRSTATSRC